jgi:RNA polymerase sigma-70 factor (ECF subfamily)
VHLLIERLPPAERAVFVLREAFGYPFRDIAYAVGISEANARQLANRTRRHVAEQRHYRVDRAERASLSKAFVKSGRVR